MNYRELFKESNYHIRERYDLSMERIEMITNETEMREPWKDYFHSVAKFILRIQDLVIKVEREELENFSISELDKLNKELYEDIVGRNYETSYANPTYAVNCFGEGFGQLLSFLYTEIRAMIVYAYEQRLFDITINNELFIQIYNLFEDESSYSEISKAIYWFISDYSDTTIEFRIREQLDKNLDFALNIIMNSDLSDIRYLYRFGEYISENEIKTAQYLNTLSQEEIDAMASTYTEGYIQGFKAANIDLSKKTLVNIRYNIGFERMIKSAIIQFNRIGLEPVIFRSASNSINKKNCKIGYISTSPNKQYDYDHRNDQSLYLDKAFIDRKVTNLRLAYEKYKKQAKEYAGPACVEIFGEIPFEPVSKKEACSLDEKQQKLSVDYVTQASSIINEYIRRDEYSFTIIAYPIFEIGEQYEEIFREVVKVNTLDKELYKKIQQVLIDCLDKAHSVRVVGCGNNKTNIEVMMHDLKNINTQTNFENCLADVNIPVGEVFTSPKLTNTNGILHVSEVYLNELKYKDLLLEFQDGEIINYTCKNFVEEEQNKKFIKENLMFNRDTLPIGEFAIGTNTTAYVMAHKYDIVYKLPILIVEKMGPHFAIGDTCYSYSEENKVYNPDGKEIVAKDNEVSILRKQNVEKAYFNCHTDITIPYDEIKEITAISKNGEEIAIIKDGRFVLNGTEELNIPFENNKKSKN